MLIASIGWRRSTSNIISYSPEEQTFSHSGYLMKMIKDSTLVGWSTEEVGSFHCDLLAQEFEPGIKEVLLLKSRPDPNTTTTIFALLTPWLML